MANPPDSPASAQPPVEVEGTRIGEPGTTAAGLKAVRESMAISVGEMGMVRGVRALLRLNQRDGFDCQSCAWPNPDGDRHVAEFCENGAKALADEATQAHHAEFFQRHTVRELAARSDYWLGKQGRLTEPMVLRPGPSTMSPFRGTTPSPWSPGAQGAPVSGQASSTRPGAPATRPRSSTSSSPGRSAPTTCRTAPTCATSRAARPRADDRHRQGLRDARRLRAGRRHFHRRAESRQQPSADADALQAAKRRGCRIVSINPLPGDRAGTSRTRRS
jgi:hypothetical protein